MTEDEKKEHIKAQRRASYIRNRDKILEKAKATYLAKGDEIRKAARERDLKDPEHTRELRRRSRHNNKERVRAESQRWREANRDTHREANKQLYYRSMQRRLYENAKNRAKKKGWTFTITIDDIIVPSYCPVFDVPFVWGEGLNDYSPSIDRIDASKGYERGNICIISTLANRIKSNATPEQIQRVADFTKELLVSIHAAEERGLG